MRVPAGADRDFTASGFVVDEGRVLLIDHTKLGRWLQPGGHIDASDASPLAAARRELLEETGVVAEPASVGPIDLDVHPIPTNPRKGEPAHEHFDVRFLFRASSAELKAGDDALDARWWPLSEVAETAEDASVRRVAGRLLTRTAGERRA